MQVYRRHRPARHQSGDPRGRSRPAPGDTVEEHQVLAPDSPADGKRRGELPPAAHGRGGCKCGKDVGVADQRIPACCPGRYMAEADLVRLDGRDAGPV